MPGPIGADEWLAPSSWPIGWPIHMADARGPARMPVALLAAAARHCSPGVVTAPIPEELFGLAGGTHGPPFGRGVSMYCAQELGAGSGAGRERPPHNAALSLASSFGGTVGGSASCWQDMIRLGICTGRRDDKMVSDASDLGGRHGPTIELASRTACAREANRMPLLSCAHAKQTASGTGVARIASSSLGVSVRKGRSAPSAC